jgi:hypothetical protein
LLLLCPDPGAKFGKFTGFWKVCAARNQASERKASDYA